jgi:hypothetical protein
MRRDVLQHQPAHGRDLVGDEMAAAGQHLETIGATTKKTVRSAAGSLLPSTAMFFHRARGYVGRCPSLAATLQIRAAATGVAASRSPDTSVSNVKPGEIEIVDWVISVRRASNQGVRG